MMRCGNCQKLHDDQYSICPFCGYNDYTPPKIAYHLTPGTTLQGRYTLGTVIGHGGFGIIYKAWDEKLNITVAIKEYFPVGMVNRIPGQKEMILLPGEKGDQVITGRKRFLDEARTIAKFNRHPQIVNIFCCFEENNTAYYVMEYLDGISLKDYIKQSKNGRMEIKAAVKIISAICEALEETHSNNILHRDVSPDNIFICHGDIVKLIDFGAARLMTNDRELTKILKPGYAPPEQYENNGRQGPWTDIYALSATLYQLVTGIKPTESIERKHNDTIVPPKQINPEVPDWLDKTILTGMALNPAIRFSNAKKFRECLNHQKETEYPPVIISRNKKRNAIFAVTSLIVILAGTILTYGILFKRYSVDVWIPYTDESDKTAFQEAFVTLPSQYAAELRFIQSSSYEAEIKNAENANILPDIWFSDDSVPADALEVSGYLSELPLDKCYLINTLSGKNKSIPLGFTVNIVFWNESFQKTDTAADAAQLNQAGSKESFCAGQCAYYIGSTDEKQEITVGAAKTGFTVGISCLKQDGVIPGTYRYSVCLRDGLAGNSLKAGAAVISHLLGKDAQSCLFCGNDNAIPLNIEAFYEYLTYNKGLSDLKNNITLFKAQNNTVQVMIDNEKPQNNVPNVQSKSETEAKQMLEAAGFTVKIEYSSSEAIAKGMVISQSRFDPAEPGTVITINVSTGLSASSQSSNEPRSSSVPPVAASSKVSNPPSSGTSSLLSADQTGVVEINSYQFEIVNNYASLIKYVGSDSSITIPSTVNGASVTSIGSNAFENCSKDLISVIIPDGVTHINDNAFFHCSNLKSITIPYSVVYIGSYAFLGCESLASITIPNNVSSIKNATFMDCLSLTSVTIPKNVTAIGTSAFSGCNLRSVTIAKDCKIAKNSFDATVVINYYS